MESSERWATIKSNLTHSENSTLSSAAAAAGVDRTGFLIRWTDLDDFAASVLADHPDAPHGHAIKLVVDALGISRTAVQNDIAQQEAKARSDLQARKAVEADQHHWNPMATPRQVEFIIDLIAQRISTGDISGFTDISRFVADDGMRIDRQAIQGLTKAEASRLITSLKGDY